MLKYLPFSLLLLLTTLLSAEYKHDRLDYVRILERADDSLAITKYVKIKNPEDCAFLESYWKVYYQQGKIVGEELYEKNKLVYYYVYYHTKEKIYQRGYFWHGIYSEIHYFSTPEKNIKQGYMYKNYPSVYNVYNTAGKLVYQYHYRDFEH